MKKCRGKPRVISESQRLYSPEAEIISSISPPFLPPFFFLIYFLLSQPAPLTALRTDGQHHRVQHRALKMGSWLSLGMETGADAAENHSVWPRAASLHAQQFIAYVHRRARS